MLSNLHIFHHGAAVYTRNLSGATLDTAIVQGFSSSLATFISYLAKTRKTHARGGVVGARDAQNSYFRSGSDLFIYMQCGAFTLVSHSPADAGKEMVERQLLELHRALVFLFGPHGDWGDDILFDGIDDIVDYIFHAHTQQLHTLVGGLRSVALPTSSRDQLDRLLATLEERDTVFGGMLTLGSSVLHTRIPQQVRSFARKD